MFRSFSRVFRQTGLSPLQFATARTLASLPPRRLLFNESDMGLHLCF
jgi:hypothetical protein